MHAGFSLFHRTEKKMKDIVIQQAMANILFNKLMENFDDLEGLSSILTSKEFRILTDMAELLDNTEHSKDGSTSIDYDLVIEAWNKFHKDVVALNEGNIRLLNLLTESYQLQVPDAFLLFGSLINHEAKIARKLTEADRVIFKEYIREGNRIILDFKTSLLNYNASDLIDSFFDQVDVAAPRNIAFQPISVGEKTIYLDQNAVSAIVDNPKFMHQCLAGIESNKISFVYSSYLIEDSINMNPIFLKGFLDNLLLLTKSKMVGLIDGEPHFVTEDIQETIHRVQKYSKATKIGEHHRLISAIHNYHNHPELRKGNTFNNELIKGPIDFFRCTSKVDIAGFELVSSKFSDRELLADFIYTGQITENALGHRGKLINEMLELYDFINFETETVKLSNAKKIASSHRDNMHLIHASIADIFITNDEKMKSRGKVLYPCIGATTKVITSKEFREQFSSFL